MTLRLSRSRQAELDLIDIWTWIAQANEPAADRLLESLDRRAGRLTDYPHMGGARDDLSPGLRYLVVGEYVILYRVLPNEVEIVRYLHGRRDFRGVFPSR